MRTLKAKKQKAEKNSVVKRKLKFEDYQHCLEEFSLKIKQTNYKKYKLNVNILRESHKEFIIKLADIKITAKIQKGEE